MRDLGGCRVGRRRWRSNSTRSGTRWCDFGTAVHCPITDLLFAFADALHRRGGQVVVFQVIEAARDQLPQAVSLGAASLCGQMFQPLLDGGSSRIEVAMMVPSVIRVCVVSHPSAARLASGYRSAWAVGRRGARAGRGTAKARLVAG